jgi:hypothetical protein
LKDGLGELWNNRGISRVKDLHRQDGRNHLGKARITAGLSHLQAYRWKVSWKGPIRICYGCCIVE